MWFVYKNRPHETFTLYGNVLYISSLLKTNCSQYRLLFFLFYFTMDLFSEHLYNSCGFIHYRASLWFAHYFCSGLVCYIDGLRRSDLLTFCMTTYFISMMDMHKILMFYILKDNMAPLNDVCRGGVMSYIDEFKRLCTMFDNSPNIVHFWP